MRNKNISHDWNVSPKEAIEIQKELRNKISLQALTNSIETIAGADVSLNMFGKDLYAGIIVLSYPGFKLIEHATVKMEIPFPYIPGLLSFREIPALIKCWEKLKSKPDLVMVDGQGIAHPRRLGIATHFGLLTGVPTVGVAKSSLTGVFQEPTMEHRESKIIDPKTKEIIGVALKTKIRSKPIIISPGNLITLAESVFWVLKSLNGYRLPEPTRQAHLLVNAFRQGK